MPTKNDLSIGTVLTNSKANDKDDDKITQSCSLNILGNIVSFDTMVFHITNDSTLAMFG